VNIIDTITDENTITTAAAAKAAASNPNTVLGEKYLMMGGSSILSTTISSSPLRDLALMMREGVVRQFLFRDKTYSNVIKNENINDENIDSNDDAVVVDDDSNSNSNDLLAVTDYSPAIIQYESKQYHASGNHEDENNDINRHDENNNNSDSIYGNEDEEDAAAAALGFKRNTKVSNRWKQRILSKMNRIRRRNKLMLGYSLKRIITKIRIRQDHNSLGVWLKKGRQRAIKKKNAEL